MTILLPALGAASGSPFTVPHVTDPTSRRAAPLMRRVEIAWLSGANRIEEGQRLVPSLPAFEEAFAAFARGTLLSGPGGPIAVEDLWPGMEVRTAQGTLARLRWRGATLIVPGAPGQDPAMTSLTRLATEALGLGRPFHDLVLGPRARTVSRRPGVRLLTGCEAALVPASDLVDGVQAVDVTPAAPVEVFHLLFDRHERLLANGVEVESHHPGPLHAFPLRGEQLALYLACFPHLDDLLGFGEPALPRLRVRDLEIFDAV
jgi:hypothetical protein